MPRAQVVGLVPVSYVLSRITCLLLYILRIYFTILYLFCALSLSCNGAAFFSATHLFPDLLSRTRAESQEFRKKVSEWGCIHAAGRVSVVVVGNSKNHREPQWRQCHSCVNTHDFRVPFRYG